MSLYENGVYDAIARYAKEFANRVDDLTVESLPTPGIEFGFRELAAFELLHELNSVCEIIHKVLEGDEVYVLKLNKYTELREAYWNSKNHGNHLESELTQKHLICDAGHIYDSSKFDLCPICRVNHYGNAFRYLAKFDTTTTPPAKLSKTRFAGFFDLFFRKQGSKPDITEFSRCFGCFEETVGQHPCPNCGWDKITQSNGRYLEAGVLLKGRYRLGRVLSSEEFSITYLGWDEQLGTKVAVKEYLWRATRLEGTILVAPYHDSKKAFSNGIKSFLNESHTLALFKKHPNIVTVTDFFKANSTAYRVMNYDEGITLAQHLSNQPYRTITWQLPLPIFIQVMNALEAVHAVNLIHHDIHPGNIYLTKPGTIKLFNFGAAQYYSEQNVQELRRNKIVLTVPWPVRSYYAPQEQLPHITNDKQQGPWTNVYSLGAMLSEVLTGKLPPSAADRLQGSELILLSAYMVDAPSELEGIIHTALALNPEDRYQTVEEMQKPLLALLQSC